MTHSPTSMTIAEFRDELGLSLEDFGRLVGLRGKGQVSVICAENFCSLPVALKIEELSGGRIDAATINKGVAAARAARPVAA